MKNAIDCPRCNGIGYVPSLTIADSDKHGRRAFFWDRVYLDILHHAMAGDLGKDKQSVEGATIAALEGARLALRHFDKEATK